jgi:hypothetical protein
MDLPLPLVFCSAHSEAADVVNYSDFIDSINRGEATPPLERPLLGNTIGTRCWKDQRNNGMFFFDFVGCKETSKMNISPSIGRFEQDIGQTAYLELEAMVIDVARMNDVYGSQVGNNMLQPLNVPRWCPKTSIVLILATSKDGQWLIPQEKQQNN